jgi:hypothetical protein
MAKVIKNISSELKSWGGVFIAPNESYTCLNIVEARLFFTNDSFITALSTGLAEVYSDSTKIVGTSNALNFLNDEIKDADGSPIVRTRAFTNADGFRFRGVSFKGTVLAGQTTNIDYELPMERYCNGGRLIVSQTGPDDEMTFQVVDVNNVLGYGAGVVLDEFITKYYVPDSGTLEVKLDYPAKIMAYLFLRIKYKNTSATDTTLKCNLFLHWKSV